MKRDLTTGSVGKTVVYFSLPYLFSYFLQTLYGMADLFIIGQFCETQATTAVTIGSQVMHMLTVMIVGLAMGATVRIAQAVGAKRSREVSKTIGNSATLFMVVAVALTILLLCATRGIVSLMSTPTEAVTGTISYLTICFLGIPFITAYNIIGSVFRGMGDSKSPMYFIAIACVVNIGLDYLFIGYMNLGPLGAALGTTLAQTVSVLISLWVILKRDMGIHLTKEDLRIEKKTMGSILTVGVPIAFQDGIIQIAFLAITVFANRRGLDDAAAVGVVEKVIGILFLVPSAMLQTISALAAQNIGAGRHDRARSVLRIAMAITLSWGILCAVTMQFSAESFVSLFTKSDTVIHLGGQYMRGYSWDCIFAGVHFCFSGFFCAYGKSGISFVHNVVSAFCVRIPLSYYAAVHFTETLFPMGLAAGAGSCLSIAICVIAYVYLRRCSKIFSTPSPDLELTK